MILRRIRAVFVCICCVLVSSCTGLGALNTVLPKDANTDQVIKGVAFDTHPRQQLDIYVPKGIEDPAPVVLFFYGGSWKSGKREDYAFVGHAFNAHGYVTVLPDYRLVPEIRYPEFIVDNVNALRWVAENIDRYGGDPQRLFVVGHSAGAYNAVMLGLLESVPGRVGETLPQISAVAGLAGPYDFLPMVYQATKDAFKGVEDLPSTQPVNLVTDTSPPMVLITGTSDKMVSPEHSQSLHQAAQTVGAHSTIITYPEVGHIKLLLSLSRPFRSSTPALDDIVEFFEYVESLTKPDI